MRFSITTKIILVISTITVLSVSCASNVYAAEVYFKVVPSGIPRDEAIVVEAYIDPQSIDINVVDGVVRLTQEEGAILSTVLVETGGSVLTWWPVVPTYSEDEKVIRFTGGTSSGFDESGLLFRIRVFASSPGQLKVAWIGGSAYRNDGEGTKENVSARSLVVSVAQGVPNLINASSLDTVPPAFDSVVVGRDEYLYDGKYFISFHATDNVSGVSRYEVREGGEVTDVLDGVYVLHDQNRETRVDITAYDAAGNSKSMQVPLRYTWISVIIIVSILCALVIFTAGYVYRKYKNNHS